MRQLNVLVHIACAQLSLCLLFDIDEFILMVLLYLAFLVYIFDVLVFFDIGAQRTFLNAFIAEASGDIAAVAFLSADLALHVFLLLTLGPVHLLWAIALGSQVLLIHGRQPKNLPHAVGAEGLDVVERVVVRPLVDACYGLLEARVEGLVGRHAHLVLAGEVRVEGLLVELVGALLRG